MATRPPLPEPRSSESPEPPAADPARVSPDVGAQAAYHELVRRLARRAEARLEMLQAAPASD